jgi:hypothetical protein
MRKAKKLYIYNIICGGGGGGGGGTLAVVHSVIAIRYKKGDGKNGEQMEEMVGDNEHINFRIQSKNLSVLIVTCLHGFSGILFLCCTLTLGLHPYKFITRSNHSVYSVWWGMGRGSWRLVHYPPPPHWDRREILAKP